MKKVEIISKPVIKEIREKLSPIIEKFFKDNYEGLEGRVGNASFTDKTIAFKLDIKAEGISAFDVKLAALYGWPEIGTSFRQSGQQFKVIGYNPKKYKFPIIASNDSGKNYCFTPEDVKKLASAPIFGHGRKEVAELDKK